MDNFELESIAFDYYDNAPSYVKMIVDMLPESKMSNDKKYIVKELYNFYLNHSSDDKIEDVISASRLFREKITIADFDSLVNFVNYIHNIFLDHIIFGSMDDRCVIFDTMNENIKLYSGYYDEYKKANYHNVESNGFIRR